MNIEIKYFANLADEFKIDSETLTVPDTLTNLSELRALLALRGPRWEQLLNNTNTRCAINHVIADEKSSIADSDEVAFFPPFTGG